MPPVQQGQPVSQEVPMAGSVPVVGPKVSPYDNKSNGIAVAVVFGIISLVAIVAAGILGWMLLLKNVEYDTLNQNLELEIAEAVSNAKTEQAMEDAAEAKKDTRQFTGPTDYGQLSFDFPKSWSVYVASDASKGGDFIAYLNPLEIEPVSESTVYALRVTIRDKDFESVVAEYQRYLTQGSLSMNLITVGGATANRYVGNIPGTELNGIIVIFKIRDKTAILRTDAMGYQQDFETILNSVKFNA